MNYTQHNQIVGFIWSIADDVLRDVYTRGKYHDIILPFTVLRRLDALLEPTKDKVLEMHQKLNQIKVAISRIEREIELIKEYKQCLIA